MNVVYNYKPSDDTDIELSIESVFRHYRDAEEIFIIGPTDPDIKDKRVNYIHASEHHKEKEKRLVANVDTFCAQHLYMDNFLYMTDDMFFIMPTSDRELTAHFPYCLETEDEVILRRKLSTIPDDQLPQWSRMLLDTMNHLKAKNRPFHNYACHVPVIFNTHMFRMAYSWWGDFNWQIETGYFNLWYAYPETTANLNFRAGVFCPVKDKRFLDMMSHGKRFLVHGKGCLNDTLRDFLAK